VGSISQVNDDEVMLWQQWRNSREPSAREALLALHLPYAKVVAAMLYAHRVHDDIEFDDYLQYARIGLLEAFERYDPCKGAQFRTYAASRIRGAVLDGLTHLTEHQQQMELRRRLLAERTQSLAQGQADDGSLPGSVDLFQYLAQVGLGMAIGLMLEDTGMFVQPGQACHRSESTYQAVELRRTYQQVQNLLSLLPPAEHRVIHLHYQQGRAFEDIARELGLTKGRISQIHKAALQRLRRMVANHQSCDRAF